MKELERLGIGRPSTYASIISTLTDREYAVLEQKKFQPTPLGETVANVLVRLFPDLFSVGFTSLMEAELDKIEEGELQWHRVLDDFYQPFQRQLSAGELHGDAIIRAVVAGDAQPCPECGRELAVRWNRFGRFLACTGYPECRYTRPLDQEKKAEPRPTGLTCPSCGGELVEREGRFGTFISVPQLPQVQVHAAADRARPEVPKVWPGRCGREADQAGQAVLGLHPLPGMRLVYLG